MLERHSSFGQEISSRNSEVIHAGIYYPEGSLKASLCVEGAKRLYDICERYAIPHKRIGKLIVAVEQREVKKIEELFEKGKRNNIKELSLLDKSDCQKIEPNTNAIAALYSPNTGIIDTHSLMKHFLNIAQSNGVLFAFNSEVRLLSKEGDWFTIGVKQEDYRFKSKIVINCAGLSSDYIASLTGIDILKIGYKLRYCKGSYFSYARRSPIKMLIYPVPHDELEGLGVHATLDLGGRLKFGPDIEYVDTIDYKVDPNKTKAFFRRASRIIPGLQEDAFMPDMAGIRPKLSGQNEKVKDFVIKDETEIGLQGLINLIGIESPGLTASPAIAQMVASLISEILG
ncbi:MAG: NAD(P)/FAD-dependent oxidoreductase [Thermodesulfobacteriota bacterium]